MTAADWPRRPVQTIHYRDGVGPNVCQITLVRHAPGEQAEAALWQAVEAAALGNEGAFPGTAHSPRLTAPLGDAPPALAVFREPATFNVPGDSAFTFVEWGTWRRHARHEDDAPR